MANEIKQVVTIAADISKIRGDLNTLEGDFSRRFANIESRAKQVGSALQSAFGIGFTVGGVTAFTKQIVDASIAAERITNSLKVVAGDSKTAGGEFEFVRETAKRMGLDLQTAADQYSKLAAASKGTALQGQETRDIFQAVSGAAVVLGLSADQTSGALNSIQQMISKGTVQAEELRGQLGERLPGAFQMAARAMGVTTQQLGKMLENGEVGLELLPKLTVELNKTFGPGLAAAAESTQAKLNRLTTAWFELKVAVANSGFITAVVTLFEGWNKTLEATARLVERTQNALGFQTQQSAARAMKDRIANIDEAVKSLRNNFDALNRGAKTPTLETALDENIKQRAKLLEEREKLEAQLNKGAGGLIPPANGVTIPVKVDEKSKKKAQEQVDNFLDGLTKQIENLNAKQIELKFGESAGIAAKLDADFARFKENLKGPVPKGLEEFFTTLRDKIVAADESLTKLQESLKRLEGFDLLDASTGAKADQDRENQAAAEAKRLREQLGDIEKAASLEVLPESERRIEIIRREFEERKKIAQDYLAALKESGATESQIVAETARVNNEIAQSSQAAIHKINEEIKKETDDVTEFQRRTWERMADSVSDLLTDIADGQIKSWEDLAKRLNKMVSSITAELASQELKKIILGPEYGKKGGELGGLAKGGMDWLQSIFGGGPRESGRVPAYEPSAKHGGNTPVDALDAEMGQMLAGLTQSGTVAIEAAGATAQSGIQALSTSASAALQASQATAQTTITTVGQTTQAAIEAVKTVAITAIEAAAAAASSSSSGGGMPGMDMMGGGGGGGGMDFMGMFGSMFGGATDSGAASAGGGLVSSMGYHDGGRITPGGEEASFKLAQVLDGRQKLKPNERPIIVEDDEFILRKEAVRAIGLGRLNYANEKLELPRFHTGGLVSDMPMMGGPGEADMTMMEGRAGRRGGGRTEIHIHGAQNPDEFRKTRNQWMGDVARAVMKGQKQL